VRDYGRECCAEEKSDGEEAADCGSESALGDVVCCSGYGGREWWYDGEEEACLFMGQE